MERHNCRECGKPTVPEIDHAAICPECKRLQETLHEYGCGDKPRNDQIRISEGCYRSLCP